MNNDDIQLKSCQDEREDRESYFEDVDEDGGGH